MDGKPCSTLSRDTRAYTSSAPCDGDVSILSAACGYDAFNFARCTSACHCRYGYSCISLAHTGVFSSSPPAMEITSWPLGKRRVPATRGTVTRSARRRCESDNSAPHWVHDTVLSRGAACCAPTTTARSDSAWCGFSSSEWLSVSVANPVSFLHCGQT